MKHGNVRFRTEMHSGELAEIYCYLCGEVLWKNEPKRKARFVLGDYGIVVQVVDDESGEVLWEPTWKETDEDCPHDEYSILA